MMQEPIWIGSPVDVRHGDYANDSLSHTNDSKYWTRETGTIKVDKERWLAAQQFEHQGWMTAWSTSADDRSHEHRELFDDYLGVPHELGDVLEVGCGPFTQFRTIRQHWRGPSDRKDRIVSSVTLQDPLLNEYLGHQNCSYAAGFGVPTSYIPYMLEEFKVSDKFDTVICINVLEHVMDVMECMKNILDALKKGGTLIFGERYWNDFDPHKLYDVGHPIRINSAIVDDFKKYFNVLFERNDSGYFIGFKK